MIKLSEISSKAPKNENKKDVEDKMKKIVKKIGDLSEVLYARTEQSILIVLQGMDSSGKDGVTEKVFRYVSPNICGASSFKKPTDLEFSHDFLWRVHAEVPAKGHIKIFNRSHYEDVLIQRVHKWIDEDRAVSRLGHINNFERLLVEESKTTVLKFYLHISYDEQKKELSERIEVKEKNYKHNAGDWKERENWDEYMRCYEDALNRSDIAWHIVPADDSWYRNYVVAKTVLETLESMPQNYPDIDLELPPGWKS